MPLNMRSVLGSAPSASTQAAWVTFTGPDSSMILATNASGQQIAQFNLTKNSSSSFAISRLLSQPMPICTGKKSSLSGYTTLHVHNQEVKLHQTLASMHDTWKMDTTSVGQFKWVFGGLGGFKLEDANGTVLAKGSRSKKTLEVFVQVDEVLLDVIMAGWVALVRRREGGSEPVTAALDIIGAVAGA